MSQLLQSKLECVLDDVPYILDNLRHSKDESAKQIYQQVLKDPDRVVSVPKGLDLVKKQGFALNTDASYAYPKLKGKFFQEIENKKIKRKLHTKILKHRAFLSISNGCFSFYFVAILSDREICNLQEVKYLNKIPGHPAVPLKSSLKELIKIRFLRLYLQS